MGEIITYALQYLSSSSYMVCECNPYSKLFLYTYVSKFIFQPIPHIITYYIYLSELVPVPTTCLTSTNDSCFYKILQQSAIISIEIAILPWK